MITIKRKRYIILRTEDNSIFCGLARNYEFRKLDQLKNTPVKTYESYKKAKSSFLLSWWRAEEKHFEDGTYKIIEVIESINEVLKNE